MSSIVVELQRETLDPATRLSDLLRKAYLVATKLQIPQLQDWLKQEMSGYGDVPVPHYRKVPASVRALNPYRGWQDVEIRDDAVRRCLAELPIRQPVSELESFVEASSGQAMLSMFYPNLPLAADLPVYVQVAHPTVWRILDAVRTAVLDWALQLEANGVLGEGLMFSDREKQTASTTSHIVNNFFAPVGHAALYQHSSGIAHTTHAEGIPTQQVLNIIAEVRELVRGTALDDDVRAEIETELTLTYAAATAPKPRMESVRQGLLNTKVWLEGIAASATIVEAINRVLTALG
jgi:hypothetical protein